MDAKKLSGKPQSQQISAIWKHLDYLAQNNPEEYQKFIKDTLDDGMKDGLGPPERFFSIQTHKVPKVIPLRDFYINACKWKQVPPPKSETSSIPMISSELREELINNNLCYTFDIAINPETLEECVKRKDEKEMLMDLLIRYTEHQTQMRLSSEYKLHENEYKGNKDNLFDMICPEALKKAARETKSGLSDHNLMNQLKKMDLSSNVDSNDNEMMNMKLRTQDEGEIGQKDILLPTQVDRNNDTFLKETYKSVLKKENVGVTKNQVNQSTKIDNDDLIRAANTAQGNTRSCERLATPEYTESIEIKDGSTFLVVKVDLPGLVTMNDCDVDITEDSLELFAPGKYKLATKLSKNIDEENTEAIFVRKASMLVLKMKCL